MSQGMITAGASDRSPTPMAERVQTKGEQRMSAEDNKALIRRVVEELNRGNLDVVDEVYAPDFKEIALWPDPRIPSTASTASGTQGFKEGFRQGRAAFPDGTWTIEELTAEGDIVMLCETFRGTHTGGGFLDLAPTGKKVHWTSFAILRFAGGKVVEVRTVWDRLGAFQQLGVLPSQEELNPKSRPMPTAQ